MFWLYENTKSSCKYGDKKHICMTGFQITQLRAAYAILIQKIPYIPKWVFNSQIPEQMWTPLYLNTELGPNNFYRETEAFKRWSTSSKFGFWGLFNAAEQSESLRQDRHLKSLLSSCYNSLVWKRPK